MIQTNAIKVIDGRGLEPPEPFMLMMEALNGSCPGEATLLLLLREPFPLYHALDAGGFAYQTRHAADGTVEILGWRSPE
ncbi:MAG: hypothetical protein ACD_10C00018G0001 [uncultured bacterium]|nr:MAG: hypothetical protein ACD_10C00018G0001 [uncultured bacterium]